MRPEEVPLLLLCEGSDDSLDLRVLGAVLARHTDLFVRVAPAGNGVGFDVLCGLHKHPLAQSVLIKDRDFDVVAEGEPLFNGKLLRWRRHEVENFLVDPAVLHEYFEGLRREDPPFPWMSKAPASQGDVREMLRAATRAHLVAHVGKSLFADRTRRLGSYGLRYVAHPTPLPTTAEGWIAGLRAQLQRVAEQGATLAADPGFDASAIEAEFRLRLAEAEGGDLMRSDRFLRELEGKTLVACVHAKMHGWGATRLTLRGLHDGLVAALERALAAGHVFEPDDFGDLVAHLRAIAVRVARGV